MSGAEPLMIAAALAAGGTAVNYAAEKKAGRDRRNILNRSFEDTQKATDKATKLLTGEGENYAGDARRQAMADQEAAAFAQTQKDLASAGAGGDLTGTAGDSGNVSSDFLRAKADKALTEGDRLTSLAREAAKVRAPSLLQQQEKMRQGDVMSRTGAMWGDAQGRQRAAALDAQSVQAPWWGTVGKLAQMAGLAYLGSGAGAGAAGGAGGAGSWYSGANAAGVGAGLV